MAGNGYMVIGLLPGQKSVYTEDDMKVSYNSMEFQGMDYYRPADVEPPLIVPLVRTCEQLTPTCSIKWTLRSKIAVLILLLSVYIFIYNVICMHNGIFKCFDDEYVLKRSPPIYHLHKTPPEKIMTMFTTFKPLAQKDHIHRNTIRNWAEFKNRMNLIYYHCNETISGAVELRNLAEELGWIVREAPVLSKDIPVLRHMFLDAQNISSTPYYGYANGDMLFTDSLFRTLEGLYDYLFKRVLMVGRRTNIMASYFEGTIMMSSDVVTSAAAINGSLFAVHGEDYFFTTKDGFPWTKVPDFVVGRIGYDNWLVGGAILRDIPVVDLTETLLAVHQTDNHGNYEGHMNKTKFDLRVNYRLIEKNFNFALGLTTCSQLYTESNGTTVLLKPRLKNECRMLYRKKRKKANLFKYSIREYVPPDNVSDTPTNATYTERKT